LDYTATKQVLSSEFFVFMQSLPAHWQEKVSGAVFADRADADRFQSYSFHSLEMGER
jgi:hypothetical protein